MARRPEHVSFDVLNTQLSQLLTENSGKNIAIKQMESAYSSDDNWGETHFFSDQAIQHASSDEQLIMLITRRIVYEVQKARSTGAGDFDDLNDFFASADRLIKANPAKSQEPCFAVSFNICCRIYPFVNPYSLRNLQGLSCEAKLADLRAKSFRADTRNFHFSYAYSSLLKHFPSLAVMPDALLQRLKDFHDALLNFEAYNDDHIHPSVLSAMLVTDFDIHDLVTQNADDINAEIESRRRQRAQARAQFGLDGERPLQRRRRAAEQEDVHEPEPANPTPALQQ